MARAEKEAEINHILKEDYIFLINNLNEEVDEMQKKQHELNQFFDKQKEDQLVIIKDFEVNSVKEFTFITDNCQKEID
jgi:hypothetical protein